ncbi:hypothetical protein Bca52824_033725 [Brassica carinata]|uniref:Uncharacterized protein n=1 Tax=Brassica carinata TaxID=52824 RepID=A0A8X7SDF2_BRACI|nr:hypothetical protein Bca52824_033725 [Brassica carinata]
MVTAIATPIDNSDTIITSSRDKSIILWKLNKDEKSYGIAQRRLTGHSHFVEDVALSGSCDGDLRLWDLATGVSTRRFVGHTKDVLSVAFSTDNRQIVSASHDGTIKLWNTLGECKYTIGSDQGDGHKQWVSCVRFSPNTLVPTIVSASWDSHREGTRSLVTLVTSTLWLCRLMVLCVLVVGKTVRSCFGDLAEGKKLYSLEAGSIIHSLCFSPNRYWLCAATENSIRIWDLESKSVVEDLKVDLKAEPEKSDASVGTGTRHRFTRFL